MKANEIMTSAKRTFSKVGFGLQKKSPEILVGIGIVGAVASAVLACKATTKAGAIVEESKNSLADIREAKENGVTLNCEHTERSTGTDADDVQIARAGSPRLVSPTPKRITRKISLSPMFRLA